MSQLWFPLPASRVELAKLLLPLVCGAWGYLCGRPGRVWSYRPGTWTQREWQGKEPISGSQSSLLPSWQELLLGASRCLMLLNLWVVKAVRGASLVAQWLRVCLLMQGTRVRALVWEDPTCHGATRPVSHNYWACASGACAPQQERLR